MDVAQRIVCLTEEPTEILYLLGEAHRIVGNSAYTVRPPQARSEKPVVCAFVDGSIAKIKKAHPDLVIGFSDVQASFAAELIREGLQVLIFNQRSIAEILGVIATIGRLVGAGAKADALVEQLQARLQAVAARHGSRGHRPRVYFEEWPDPRIVGSQWVSELIQVAGGEDVFSTKAVHKRAQDRVVTDAEIMATTPDVILASWCGKTVDINEITTRSGFETLPAVRAQRVFELDSSVILQPGPAALTDGLSLIEQALASV